MVCAIDIRTELASGDLSQLLSSTKRCLIANLLVTDVGVLLSELLKFVYMEEI